MDKNRNQCAPRAGFTLIELILVVVILSILVSMVAPRLVGRSQEARIAAAHADVSSNLSTALDLYELDNGKYPESLDVLTRKTEEGKGPYLKRQPVDPWKKLYNYKTPGVHNTEDYDLYSLGPDGEEGTADDITNWEVATEEK
ncbi:MAG: type II secretion system major pseudopilin GspG [Candidatus Omnitrophota bacterium]